MDLKRRAISGCVSAEGFGTASHPDSNRSVPLLSASQRPFTAVLSMSLQTHNTPSTSPNLEIVPMDLHHPILREFPEHREVIRRLKGANEHFRNVFDEYHRLDDEIYRIEEEIDFATDQEIEELKMRRAKLKDYIYHVIRHAPPTCPVCEGTGVAR
jgi:uncharacterized protein YdcH (DUF465 family)